MSNKAQKAQDFSLELIGEENYNTKPKDASTLTSLAESTSEKFLKKQTFYQRHHDYLYSTTLTLTLDELTIKGQEKLIIPVSDLLGATAKPYSKSKSKKEIIGEEDLWCLNIYLMTRYRQTGLGVSEDAIYKRKYQKLKFVIWSSDAAVKWKNLILQTANNPDFSSTSASVVLFNLLRHLLVFINTKSGGLGGIKSWEKAKKLLRKAGCEFTEVFTQYGGHSKDYMRKCDVALLKEVDGFLTVSGDGGLHEIVNGLLQREDGKNYFHLPFGIIPGGTNNCMDKNLLFRVQESVSIKTVCHFIAKGRTIKSDLTLMETENKEKIYNIGIFAWAAFATIDLESSKLRALGKTRFTLYGIWNVLNMRKYNGRFLYTTADVELPDINTELRGEEWKTRTGPFTNLSIHNLPWISTQHRACPSADFQDGLNHAFVLGGDHLNRVSLCKYCECLMNEIINFKRALARVKGKKLKHDTPMVSLGNEHYKMKAFRIEPFEGDKPSLYDIDGEAYKATKIQGKVLEKVLTLYCPQQY